MKDLKIPFFTILFIFIVFFLFVKLVGPIPFYVNSLQTTKTTSFQTTGEGKATAVPDSANVVIGVRENSATVQDAQSKVNHVANRIIEDIKKLGIDEKDIKTVNYSVNPEYDYSRDQRITGYTVNQNLQIHIKPIEKLTRLLIRQLKTGQISSME